MENPSDYRVGSPFAPEPLTATATDTQAADDVFLAADSAPIAGSPFEGQATAVASASVRAKKAAELEPETLGYGVWTETATAAAYSAVILLTFAIACVLIFPAGGIAVTALGAVLSLLGLSSRRVRLSVVTLVLHGVLFFVCYLRAI